MMHMYVYSVITYCILYALLIVLCYYNYTVTLRLELYSHVRIIMFELHGFAVLLR
jgi:hypothetical protein